MRDDAAQHRARMLDSIMICFFFVFGAAAFHGCGEVRGRDEAEGVRSQHGEYQARQWNVSHGVRKRRGSERVLRSEEGSLPPLKPCSQRRKLRGTVMLFLYKLTARTSKESACRHCQLLVAAGASAWWAREGVNAGSTRASLTRKGQVDTQ